MRELSEMNGAIVLSEFEIDEILTNVGWLRIIDAVAETFREEAKGETISPPKVIMQIEKYNNDYRVMPSYMHKYHEFCGTKIVAACPRNPETYGLPLAMGTYILNHAENQSTAMVCGCCTLTAYRTAAASAVAIRELVPAGDELSLGIIGCGQQAYFHIPAIKAIAPVKSIFVNSRTQKSEDKLINYFKDLWHVERATKAFILSTCDIVVTMTPTLEPHIFPEDIPDREMVIAAIGGDSDRKIELDPRILPRVDHFCDSYEQAAHTGVVDRALRKEIIFRHDLKSVGDFMIGKKSVSEKKVKLFLSTGVALEDLAMAILIYKNVGGPSHNLP